MESKHFTLYTPEELHQLGSPTWLVDGVMPDGGFGCLYGPPAVGKTFIALDLALSVAVGQPWHGRAVRQGTVVYVAAEGSGKALGRRVSAWASQREFKDQNAFFLLDPVQLASQESVEAFLLTLQAAKLRPTLIVIDTLSRCFVGRDENSAKETTLLVEGVRRISVDNEAAVLLIHHSGKSGDGERGSSVFRGAVDTMWSLARQGDALELACEKQKDGELFEEMYFRLKPVLLEDGATSCIVTDASGQPASQAISAGERRALATLAQLGPQPATSGEWREALGAAPRTFYNRRKSLLESALVAIVSEHPETAYALTDAGWDAAGLAVQRPARGPQTTAATATTL
jgi:hypothetical protein